MDLEMTGLDPEKERIIEIEDFSFKSLFVYVRNNNFSNTVILQRR